MAKKRSSRNSDDPALLLRVLDGFDDVITDLRNVASLAQGFAAKGRREAYDDLGRLAAELLSISQEGKSAAVSDLYSPATELLTGNGRLAITFDANPHLVSALKQLHDKVRRWLPTTSNQSFDRVPFDPAILDGPEKTLEVWEQGTRDVDEEPARVKDDKCRALITTAVTQLLNVLDQARADLRNKLIGRSQSKETIKRSWTQPTLDRAIREYFAARGSAFARLKRHIAQNKDGAIRQAQDHFSRNEIVRALGVKSPDMVTKSSAWQELADELGLPRGRLSAGKKIGLDVVLEVEAKNQDVAKAEEEEEMELLRLIRRKLAPDAVEETLRQLMQGKMTRDQVQEMLELL
jgi:rRNA-processing protein FCF1